MVISKISGFASTVQVYRSVEKLTNSSSKYDFASQMQMQKSTIIIRGNNRHPNSDTGGGSECMTIGKTKSSMQPKLINNEDKSDFEN